MAKKTGSGPLCPKCKKRRMARNGSYSPGVPKWTCMTGSRSTGTFKICYSTRDPHKPYRGHDAKPKRPEDAPKPVVHRVPLGNVERLVVTWAQNATPIHQPFLDALKTYCKATGATLVVIAGRYKNPTSVWTDSQRNDERWAPELAPYLHNTRKKLNDNLILVGDVKLQPTAVTPLTGFDALTGAESCILGHPKVQMKCIPTPQSQLPKILTTTGAITRPNFTDSGAGKKGEFHHSYGAVVVELQGKLFHMRHLSAVADGAFIDLDTAYFPDGTTAKSGPWPALIFGDAHVAHIDPKVEKATFGEGGLVDLLNPEVQVWHDLLDSYSVTPHHELNPMIKLAKYREGLNLAEKEVRSTVAWLRKRTVNRKSIVTASNHDDMLSRWIMRADWKLDPANAEFYLETALHMARSAKMGAGGASYIDPFQFWAHSLRGDSDIRCLGRGESFTVRGIECGMHGDDGPGGSKGSVRNLSRLGVKVMSGHGHSPAIEEGHTRVGTMSYLQLEYNRGPSNWLNSHGGIDPFGKRHLFHVINGKFRL